MAPPGAGKSTLLGTMARHANVDTVVIALIGERGREVRAWLDRHLDAACRARAVVVVATSDVLPQQRVLAAHTATAIAEFFRDRLQHRVLLLVDSLSRLARAQRDVGLAAGERSLRQGYPPSLFLLLAQLIERAGNSAQGSLSACYTLLTSDADTLEDPVAEEARSLLDGHLMLSTQLAQRGHFPALDVLRSTSRLLDVLASPQHQRLARRLRRLLACREEALPLVEMGAYTPGLDIDADDALALAPEVDRFLQQTLDQSSSLAETLRRMRSLL